MTRITENTEKVSLSLPWPILPGAEQGDIRQLCSTFVSNYEETLRMNLDDIGKYYHTDAVLTISMSNFALQLPANALSSETKEALRLQQILFDYNHNLVKSSPASSKLTRIKKGPREIAEVLEQIHKQTRLKVSLETNIADHLAVSQPGFGSQTKLTKVDMLVLKIHGNLLVQIPSLQKSIYRCYDRVWTLTRSQTGDIAIFNDFLHLRMQEASPLWTPSMGDRILKLTKKYGLPESACHEILQLASNDIQCSLLVELVAITRLKPSTALNCLTLAENDIEKAEKLFQEKKALLGPEHYLGM